MRIIPKQLKVSEDFHRMLKKESANRGLSILKLTNELAKDDEWEKFKADVKKKKGDYGFF